ncbi:oxidoreductase, partial [Bacillus cereus]|nr:oxidoreductase [Bacillus cereus]
MRFLIVGAGAIGGYFGGLLVQKGEDVTFFVRPSKKSQLAEVGLIVRSVHGDFQTPI